MKTIVLISLLVSVALSVQLTLNDDAAYLNCVHTTCEKYLDDCIADVACGQTYESCHSDVSAPSYKAMKSTLKCMKKHPEKFSTKLARCILNTCNL